MQPLGTFPQQCWKRGWEEPSKRHCVPADSDMHGALELKPAPAQEPPSSGKLRGGRFGPADINVNVFLEIKFAETPVRLCSQSP